MMKKSVMLFSAITVAILQLVTACTGVRPANLGVRNGRLAPCPASPNCVSSQNADKEHAIAPLRFSTSVSSAKANIKKVIHEMKRARIVDESDPYIHAEFTSAVWRFVDDVEFYFDPTSKTVHIRSASRLGRYDFGVNRKRAEEIRSRWEALEK